MLLCTEIAKLGSFQLQLSCTKYDSSQIVIKRCLELTLLDSSLLFNTLIQANNWSQNSVETHRRLTDLTPLKKCNCCHAMIPNENALVIFLASASYVRVKSNCDQPPPPGNPRAFDLTLPPYRLEFDSSVGNLMARPGI